MKTRIEFNDITEDQREAVRKVVRDTVAQLLEPSDSVRGIIEIQELLKNERITQENAFWYVMPCVIKESLYDPLMNSARQELSHSLRRELIRLANVATEDLVRSLSEHWCDILESPDDVLPDSSGMPRFGDNSEYCGIGWLQDLVFFKAAAALGVNFDSEKLRRLEEVCFHCVLSLLRENRLMILQRPVGFELTETGVTDDVWRLPVYGHAYDRN